MIACIVNLGLRIGAGILLTLALASCVTRSEFVKLSYPPDQKFASADFDHSSAAGSAQTACALIVRLSDERADKGRLGSISGGLIGESQTPVLTDNNVEVWVHDAIVLELDTLGFEIVDAIEPGDRRDVGTLNAVITEVSTGCYALFCAGVVNLTTTYKSPGGEMSESIQRSNESKSGFGFSYRPMMEEALRRALQVAIYTSLDDLQLLNFACDS